MKSQISILGSGPVGIQAAVYLLEQYHGEILIYDEDQDYARGMALDCMQASAVRGWQGSLRAVDSISELKEAALLIVTENNNRTLDTQWIEAVRDSKCAIYASPIEGAIEQAIKEGVSEASLLGVQGMTDARMLAEEIAELLNVAAEDVHAMVYGGIGKDMESRADFVRVSGLPVNLVEEGLFEKALSNIKSRIPYGDEPWAPNYTLAATAVELALIMESGQQAIMPINGRQGTVPSLVGNYGIQKVYSDLV